MLTCGGCGEALTLDTWLQHALLLRLKHPCVPRKHPSVGLLQILPDGFTSIWAGDNRNVDADCECICCMNFHGCNCADQPPGDRCDCQPCLVTLALAERVGA